MEKIIPVVGGTLTVAVIWLLNELELTKPIVNGIFGAFGAFLELLQKILS
ncbi:hypothetical protein FACS18949_08880 [Clostridia bacterium]|nr:hypothetical protein FACS18949_08880 [Clostridia bacterium]